MFEELKQFAVEHKAWVACDKRPKGASNEDMEELNAHIDIYLAGFAVIRASLLKHALRWEGVLAMFG